MAFLYAISSFHVTRSSSQLPLLVRFRKLRLPGTVGSALPAGTRHTHGQG
jgi:hypothetical protein